MRSPEEILREAKTIALVGDLVDVFRRIDAVPGVAQEAAEVGAKALWLQLGLSSPGARAIATGAGLDHVEDECTAIVHWRLA